MHFNENLIERLYLSYKKKRKVLTMALVLALARLAVYPCFLFAYWSINFVYKFTAYDYV